MDSALKLAMEVLPVWLSAKAPADQTTKNSPVIVNRCFIILPFHQGLLNGVSNYRIKINPAPLPSASLKGGRGRALRVENLKDYFQVIIVFGITDAHFDRLSDLVDMPGVHGDLVLGFGIPFLQDFNAHHIICHLIA